MNSIHIYLVVAYVGLTAWHTIGYRMALHEDETGRYMYPDRKNPTLRRVCSYCPFLSMTNENHISRHQQGVCIQNNIGQIDEEENRTLSFPFCRYSVGTQPGCGNLTFHSNIESWIVIGINGERLEVTEPIGSVVYHVYIPVCRKGYTLIGKNSFRCGENRRWNSSYDVECLNDDPTTLPVEDQLHDNVTSVIIICVLLLGLVLTSVTIFILYRKEKLCCGWNKRTESASQIVPPSLYSPPPPPSSVADSLDTHATYLDDKESTKTFSSRRNNGSDYTRERKSTSPLLPNGDQRINGKKIGPNSGDKVTVFGACRIPHMDTEIASYQVFAGCEIYIITRIRLKKSRNFIVYPPQSISVHLRLVKQYDFCYVISGVSNKDAGTYKWEIHHKRSILSNGSFTISVVEGYERPDPIGCSSFQYITETENERENTISDSGPPVSLGVSATPYDSNTEQSIPPHCEQSPGKCNPGNLNEISSHMNCSKFLEEVWDDPKLSSVIQSLCYLLDPLDGAPRNKRWPGLARWYLGDKMTRPYIKSIEYHKKGDPDDGPTLFLLNSFCSQGCYLGHIVWYFSQPENMYKEVVDLLVNCHECTFCENILNQLTQKK